LKLFSFSNKNNEVGIGVTFQKETLDLSQALDIYQRALGNPQPTRIAFLQVLVEMGYCSGETIRSVLSESWVLSKKKELLLNSDYHYGLPIARPSKIIGLGRNYIAHAKELHHEIPKEPLFFSKAPSALIPHGADIVIPKWLNGRIDHEAELALVIGKEGKNIPEEDALSYIAGYTILNDITARTMQKEDIDNHKPWFRSKSLDTFCPMGPFLVPADEVKDPNNLEIRLTVNGTIRQQSNTSAMIFSVPAIVSHLSTYMTLKPGDVIATGTPEGVSPVRNGDIIEITITGLGKLRNRVVKET